MKKQQVAMIALIATLCLLIAGSQLDLVVSIVSAVAIATALIFATNHYIEIKDSEAGKEDNIYTFARKIRDASYDFMKRENRYIIVTVILLSLLFLVINVPSAALTFAIGALASGLSCYFNMKAAVYANVQTARKAAETASVKETVKQALYGSSICGLVVHAVGLAGIVAILLIQSDYSVRAEFWLFNITVDAVSARLLAYSLGCSLVALFARVAGGIYTKSADIGADCVGKVEFHLTEDDPHNPATIMDLTGDNVSDVGGNGADLMESTVATIVGLIAIAIEIAPVLATATIQFAVLLSAGGLAASVLGITFGLRKQMRGNDPSKTLDGITYVTALLAGVVSFAAAYYAYGGIDHALLVNSGLAHGWSTLAMCACIGIVTGVLVGFFSEQYTSGKRVKKLAETAKDGPAFLVTEGDALGAISTLAPVFIISVAAMISNSIGGYLGIGAGAVGMLSFVGLTVSVDAFGPISDNAGGIVESCELGEDIRRVTDALDAAGNTTAAIGKGYAAGSAAFAVVTLLFSFVVRAKIDLNANIVLMTMSLMLGIAVLYLVSGLLTKYTIRGAHVVAENSRIQLRQFLAGEINETDCTPVINKITDFAARKMYVIGLVVVGSTAVVLWVGNVQAFGFVTGAALLSPTLALFNANSGGAWDNAKKMIELGLIDGVQKGSLAHDNAVIGDTVGDTRKDVVGVSLDIVVKLMATTLNVCLPLMQVL